MTTLEDLDELSRQASFIALQQRMRPVWDDMRQGHGDVGRTATGVLVEVSAQRLHDVDQGLPHHQHTALHAPCLPCLRDGVPMA